MTQHFNIQLDVEKPSSCIYTYDGFIISPNESNKVYNYQLLYNGNKSTVVWIDLFDSKHLESIERRIIEKFVKLCKE